MTIKKKAQIGGFCIAVALLFGLLTTGYEFNQIRVGGPLHGRNQIISDLQADILPPPEYILEPYLEATLLIGDPDSLPTRRVALERLEILFNDRYAYWKGSSLDADLKSDLVDRVGRDAKAFWSELDQSMLPAMERQDRQGAAASYRRLTRLYAAHRTKIDALVEAASSRQAALAASSAAALKRTVAILVAIGLLLLGLLFFGIGYLLRHALQPMADTAEAMDRMAKGDLEIEIPGSARRDEIGTMAAAVDVFRAAAKAQRENNGKQETVVHELGTGLQQLSDGNLSYRLQATLPAEYRQLGASFNAMMDSLSQTLSRVAAAASAVGRGSTEIRRASDDLSQRTEQQAASLEETAAAMNEITATVHQTAAQAGEANAAVEDARIEALQSGKIVQRAVGAMGGIERTSNEISEIVSVIDGIAFQTNLLALNAGVEAARAGDAGRGFAVVASEVRALAQRSADAAKDVKTRITASVEQVETGVGLVTEAGRTLDRIIERIAGISTLVSTIVASAKQQASGLSEVNIAVAAMDNVTQQNAAMVEEATAAARSLAAEADALAGEVARFRIGAPSAAARSRPAVHQLQDRVAAAVHGTV